MTILRTLASEFQALFPSSTSGQERWRWFMLTLQAIIVPLTPARTSNLLRAIETLFGVSIAQWRYYTFMGSVKLPWAGIWERLWRAIPHALTEGRVLIGLDDSINPKTGQKIFACQHTFDHAAKPNQSRYPWAQTIVTVGLLTRVHGRWGCVPLDFAFYLRRATLAARALRLRRQPLAFQSKFEQAVGLIGRVAAVFAQVPIVVVADSWFGNNGLFKPLRARLGPRVNLLSRLRVNAVLYACPERVGAKAGRPRKYGARRGPVAELAPALRAQAKPYQVSIYGARREVVAADELFMLKTLRCAVRVVWVYRHSQWLALVSTDLDLSVVQIIEYYAARWKLEAGFREIKQEIGSAHTQTRNPDAVMNHLQFCMVATTLTWIYGAHLPKAPVRRYASKHTKEFAFADIRRSLASEIAQDGFGIDCHNGCKTSQNSLISTVMGLVA